MNTLTSNLFNSISYANSNKMFTIMIAMIGYWLWPTFVAAGRTLLNRSPQTIILTTTIALSIAYFCRLIPHIPRAHAYFQAWREIQEINPVVAKLMAKIDEGNFIDIEDMIEEDRELVEAYATILDDRSGKRKRRQPYVFRNKNTLHQYAIGAFFMLKAKFPHEGHTKASEKMVSEYLARWFKDRRDNSKVADLRYSDQYQVSNLAVALFFLGTKREKASQMFRATEAGRDMYLYRAFLDWWCPVPGSTD